MAKTSQDARRHIRELSKMFSDGKDVAEIIVDAFINAHRKRKYLKQSLRRLSDRGFLTVKNSYYTPTKTGITFFRRNAITKSDISQSLWDGKWRLITFDVPMKHNRDRFQLRALLKEFNFYPLQKSVWICPTSLSEEFWKLVVMYDLQKYCEVMVVEILEGDEKLRKYFEL